MNWVNIRENFHVPVFVNREAYSTTVAPDRGMGGGSCLSPDA